MLPFDEEESRKTAGSPSKKWRAVGVWTVVPYLAYFLVLGLSRLLGQDVDFSGIVSPVFQVNILTFCVIPAGIGTAILWALPIRRVLVGTTSGVLLGFGGIALVTWGAIALFGGFEESPGFVLDALIFVIPSCIGGAYAGYLRVKEKSSVESPGDPKGNSTSNKSKLITILMTFPYFAYCVALEVSQMRRSHFIFDGLYNPNPICYLSLLFFCAISAALLSLLLWALPMRTALFGVAAGSLLGVGGAALVIWAEVITFGRFTALPGIFFVAGVLLIPSCLVGAYAGYLRAKTRSPAKS